ncbi:MAG TPA: amidohydrolase family protein [Acidimicrobiales bacterium]|nr:amidohydrolase family protein [Acidimicrobiales bacterium]
MLSIEDLLANSEWTTAGKGGPRSVTFLPEPPRAHRKYTVISADDHIVEPPHVFEGRVEKKFADRAPRVIEKEDGTETWVYDGTELPNVGFNAVVGRPVDEWRMEPTRFDEMRAGAWDIHQRIADMDLNGIYASLNFPSFLPGFAGQRLQQVTSDTGLAMAAVRAWNDWHLEEWAGSYPDRIIPCQLPWLLDADVSAEMIRQNADRGFRAVSFSEEPSRLGFPTIHSGYWDPFLQACEETGTVINLHIGSSGSSPATTADAPPDVAGVLFFAYAISAAVDWLFSLAPVRYPNLKICLSEGGIGWVPALLDRLDHMDTYSQMYGTWQSELTPSEVLQRNFWFCAVEDQSTFALRDRIGVDHILLESDYPHCDSTWPNTQRVVEEEIGGLPAEDIKKMTWQNASFLYRHPVPEAVQQSPDAY